MLVRQFVVNVATARDCRLPPWGWIGQAESCRGQAGNLARVGQSCRLSFSFLRKAFLFG